MNVNVKINGKIVHISAENLIAIHESHIKYKEIYILLYY